MTFLFPIYFWALLGLLPLIAVYFLKVKPRRKPTTAFFLWQAVFDQKLSTSLFDRLRDLLSLLLMMLAFIAIVFALTAPQVNDDQRSDILILIDNSASMNTNDQGGTRLQAAKETAKSIIRSLNPNQQAAVAMVSLETEYQSHFTTSPRTLLDAVDKIEPSDCPFQVEALQSLQQQDPSDRKCRIILLSDGCSLEGALTDSIELMKVGTNQPNIGLVACDLQRIPGVNQLSLYFQLASSATEAIQTDILVQYGPNRFMQKLIPITVEPGLNTPQVYTIDNGQPGLWTVEIDYKDSLAKDNTAWLIVSEPDPIRIAVKSDDTYFLEHSVLAFAQTSGDLLLTDQQPDVILTKGGNTPTECLVVFNPPAGQNWYGQFGEAVYDVIPRIKANNHPLLEHCDIESMPFIGAREVTLPDDSLVLVETQEHVPLIYRVRSGKNSAVVFNMSLEDSEFYYSAWFPVTVYNAARHLTGRSEHIASAYPVGSVIAIPAINDEQVTTITHNDSEDSIENTGNLFGPVRWLGYYTLNNSTGQWQLGTGLFKETVTLINNDHIAATANPLNRGWPPSIILSAFALLILLLECILYHRRKVG